MSCKGFVVAMRARVSLPPPEHPAPPEEAAGSDWLIVSRWGAHAEYLTISVAGGPGAYGDAATPAAILPETAAPVGLHPLRTFFATLAPEAPARGETMFVLTRWLPPGMPVAGRFVPAEGYARLLTAPDGTLGLVAVAREAEAAAPPIGPGALLTAEHCAWVGEFLDCRD